MSSLRLRNPKQRKGYLLVVNLAAMTIAVGILLPMVPATLRARRQIQLEQDNLQAEFLKDAALRYGLQQLANAPSYRGDRLSIPLGGNASLVGECEIQFDISKEGEGMLAVTAKLRPADSTAPTGASLQQSQAFQEWKLPSSFINPFQRLPADPNLKNQPNDEET